MQLEVQSFDDPKAGYKLVLRFAENEFFEDEIVQKEVRYLQEGSEPMHCYVAPCRLKWKNEVRLPILNMPFSFPFVLLLLHFLSHAI